jgi:hypothetical protein
MSVYMIERDFSFYNHHVTKLKTDMIPLFVPLWGGWNFCLSRQNHGHGTLIWGKP